MNKVPHHEHGGPFHSFLRHGPELNVQHLEFDLDPQSVDPVTAYSYVVEQLSERK